MIHTIQLQKLLSKKEAEILLDLYSLPKKQADIEDFLYDDPVDGAMIRKRFLKPTLAQLHRHVRNGITNFRFGKFFDMTHGVVVYYITITIDLEVFIRNEATCRLYVATDYNNRILERVFGEAIYKIFPGIGEYKPYFDQYTEALWFDFAIKKESAESPKDVKPIEIIEVEDFDGDIYPYDPNRANTVGSLPYLALWSVKRIDYSVNILVPDKELFLRLVRASFLEVYPLKIKENVHCNLNFEASSANGNIVFKMYDKAEKLLFQQNNRKGDLKWTRKMLAEEGVENLVRYELSISSPTRLWIQNHSFIDKTRIKEKALMFGPLPLLNEIFSVAILNQYYLDCIGMASWYDYDHFTSYINESKLSTRRKNEMTAAFVHLVNYAGGIKEAWPLYEKGITVPTWKSGEKVFGRKQKESFDGLVKAARDNGIQPVILNSFKDIPYFENPYESKNCILKGEECEPFITDKIPVNSFSMTMLMEFLANTAKLKDLFQNSKRILPKDTLFELSKSVGIDDPCCMDLYDYAVDEEDQHKDTI